MAASKVNTKFVFILVGALLALAIGVGGLAAYSLRMSGERNIAAGDRIMAEAMQARASGDEQRAFELINDAASQYGRAVSKDRTRRDWLVVWRDTLLQTRPDTEVEYDKQLRERYVGAMDRLAAIDPNNPQAQHEYVSFIDELFRTYGSQNALQGIVQTIDSRVAFLPAESPTAIRLRGLRGLAINDQVDFELLDQDRREEARVQMEAFYTAFKDDPQPFLAPLDASPSAEEASAFANTVREQHSRVARGLIRWHINEQRVANAEGRTQDASRAISAALSAADAIMGDGFGFDRDVRFMALRMQAATEVEGIRIANPSQRQQAQLAVVREVLPRMLAEIRSMEGADIPMNELASMLVWDRDWAERDQLVEQLERAVAATPSHGQRLMVAAQGFRNAGRTERALELYEQVRALPRPTLSIAGLLLPLQQRAAAFSQVEVNLDLFEQARAGGDSAAASERLSAAKRAREALASESGVAERGRVLRADASLAIAEGEFTRAIRLLEEFRREFGDTPEVLGQLASLLIRQGTIGEAKQLLERLASANTITPQGVILLADIHRMEGNLDLALRTLEDQSRRSTSPLEFVEPIAQVRRLIAIEAGEASDDPVFDALVRANEAVARRDFERATAILNSATRARPEAESDVRVVLLRAQVDALSGNMEAALARIERAIEQNPDNAMLLQIRDRLSSGDVVASRLAEIDGSDRPAIDKALARYSVFVSVGRTDEAMDALDEAERLQPNHPSVLEARFNIALFEGNLDNASRVAARAAEANADGVDGLLFQGRLQLARGERAEAIRTLRTASNLIPSNIEIRRYLGQALLQNGQIDEGITTLRRAYEARRDNLQVLGDYVQALRQLGRFQEARELLDPGSDPTAPARSNRSVTNIWLALEAEFGDGDRALRERRTYFAADVRTDSFGTSSDARENAIRLIELLVRENELAEAQQVFGQVEQHLSSRDGLRARTGIALGNAAKLDDPQDVARAEQEAIARFRDQASAESQATSSPDPLLDVANFAFNSGRFDLGLQVLQDAVKYEDPAGRGISRQIAQRLSQRAQRLDAEARTLDAQAAQRRGTDPLAADAIQEQAAQTRGRAANSREEAASLYSQMSAATGADSDFSMRLAEAELRLQLRQLDRADELVRAVRQAQPNNLNAMLLAAFIAEGRDDRTAAGRLYDQAVEQHSTNFLPFYRRALFRSSDRDRQSDVLFDLQRVADLRPSFTDGWLLRYRVYMQSGQPDRAFTALRQGIEAAPSNAEPLTRALVQELLRNGRTTEAATVASERARQLPSDVYWQFNAGTLARQRGAYREAAEIFARLMELPAIREDSAQLAQAAGLRLDALLRSEQNTPAQELSRLAGLVETIEATEGASAVSKAMLLARAYAGIPAERARAGGYIQQGYTAAARGGSDATPTQLLRQWFTELPPVVGGNAAAFDYVTRLDEAIRQQIASGAAGADSRPVYLRILMLQAGQVRGESPSELIARGEAIKGDVQNDPLARFELHKRLSNLHYAAGDTASAAREGIAALELNGNDLEMLNNVAFFLAKYLDRVQEARPYADRAAQLAPDSADVLDTVGVVYMLSGDYGRAAELFEQSLRFARTQEQRLPANVHMADTLIRSGDRSAARPYIEAAERLLPVVIEGVRQIYGPEVAALRNRLNNP